MLFTRAQLELMLARAELAESVTYPAEVFRDLVLQAMAALEKKPGKNPGLRG